MLRFTQRGAVTLAFTLISGCLFPGTRTKSELPPPQTIVPPPAAVSEAKPTETKNVRPALAIEPPTKVRAKLEMGPAPVAPVIPPPPPPPDSPLVAAMRGLLEKHPEKAARELERVDASRRSRLLALLKLTADISQGDIDNLPPEEAAALLDHLCHVSKDLCRRAPLKLRKVAFCRSVSGFGQYDSAGDKPTYQAGSDDQAGDRVQVYAEVCHFRNRPHKAGYETKLDAVLEVLDNKGKCLATIPLGICSDCSQSPRQDYFLNCQFNVPPGLKPGQYTLRLKVRDLALESEPRQAQVTLPLSITAPPSS